MSKLPDKDQGGKTISRKAAYAKAASHFDLALNTLVQICKTGRQESVRVSAANKIIDKVLPNLQAQDITTGGEQIQVNVVHLPVKRDLVKETNE